MPSTRSGIIYNNARSSDRTITVTVSERRSPRNQKPAELSIEPVESAKNSGHEAEGVRGFSGEFPSETRRKNVTERRSPRNQKPAKCSFFEPEPVVVNNRPKRATSHRIPLDVLKQYLNDEDDDNSSDYEEEQEQEEQQPEKNEQKESVPVAKFEVKINFDEASKAWRANIKKNNDDYWERFLESPTVTDRSKRYIRKCLNRQSK